MITKSAPSWQRLPTWQSELSHSIRDPEQLIRRLRLPLSLLPAAQAAARLFPLRVTESYLQRILPGDPADPLLRQVLPLGEELDDSCGQLDPVGDLQAMCSPGVLHKYPGRVLLVTSGACAIHCRYCFRRHFPYAKASPLQQHLDETLAYLQAHDDIHEVILSGGDPLSLPDTRLAALAEQLEQLPHLRILRLHTRLPVVLPARIDDTLLRWLGETRLRSVIVLHINHARELDAPLTESLGRLHQAGVTLLNQSVLLRGVNDSVTTLSDLSYALFGAGVLPYYLHQFDPVRGAMHFAVPDAEARVLHEKLRARLPGYLLPRLVREIPGEKAKIPV